MKWLTRDHIFEKVCFIPAFYGEKFAVLRLTDWNTKEIFDLRINRKTLRFADWHS
jgi:hypothetical protein